MKNTTQTTSINAFKLKPIAASLAVLMVLTSCASVKPQPLTKQEVQSRVIEDLETIQEFEEVDKIQGELTLEDAVARALKNNLDYRVKKMEAALAMGVADASKYDMWPKLLADAGYNSRSNFSGGTSVGIDDGLESLRPSTGQEKQFREGGVEFSWNILDFGVSYYMSKVNADRFLIAEENKRKLTQHIIQDVRAAYWRALSAQKLEREADKILDMAEKAMVKSREAEAQKIISPEVALNFQRAILDATTQLNHNRQSLVIAKHELAGLMSLPPEVEFTLAQADHAELPPIPKNITALEEMALLQRPELRITDFERRITASEAKKEALSFLPNLNFTTAFQATSNRFTFNRNWIQNSVGISWNLMKLFSRGQAKKNEELREKADEANRLALNIAVIAQVRMAAESYEMAVKDYDLAHASADVDERLAKYVEDSATAKLQNQLEVIRTQTKALLGQYMRSHAYANAQIAFGRLYSSLGFDPIHDDYEKSSIAELSQHIKQYMDESATQDLKMKSNLFGDHESFVSVNLTGINNPALKRKMQEELIMMLSRNNIHHTSKGKPLNFNLQKESYLNLETAQWNIELQNDDGLVTNESLYETTIPKDSRSSTITATLIAAATSKINEVKKWLKSVNAEENSLIADINLNDENLKQSNIENDPTH